MYYHEDLTRREYEKRFWHRWDTRYPTNANGYGVGRAWEPPIQKCETILCFMDKHYLTSHFMAFAFSWVQWGNTIGLFLYELWVNLGTGDALDGYWYNNWDAAGQQLYPEGASKYYDLYSVKGYFTFIGDEIWYEFCEMIGFYFLLGFPLDILIDII